MRRLLAVAVTVAAVVDAALVLAIAGYCAVREVARGKPAQPPTKVVRRVPAEWSVN